MVYVYADADAEVRNTRKTRMSFHAAGLAHASCRRYINASAYVLNIITKAASTYIPLLASV